MYKMYLHKFPSVAKGLDLNAFFQKIKSQNLLLQNITAVFEILLINHLRKKNVTAKKLSPTLQGNGQYTNTHIVYSVLTKI